MENIGEKRKQTRQHQQEKPYRGIRMRKWGKWGTKQAFKNMVLVCICALSGLSDIAVFYLRGRSARLNFPEFIVMHFNEPRRIWPALKPDLNEYPSPDESWD
ncbi:hypothetical protein Leryth_003696 [Lithospermum erythrorhizon]|nr:hypothetical protein Leryth_003696 [Lithospermum erythrorhizon]